ncbi:SDR family NAD(P)-dependent oxidoreductase [Paenarthrobacter sp. NPDC056912]|uniref:SDR family NAD(P)-dependent oxidoreductase n=1 Tax=Paenarthrobacter sp. NPDC056912 TaxID=3345965 RepID=UPI00366F49D7
MNTHSPHNGKRIVVTGAARGIGRGIAERFAAAGAFVTLLDRDGDEARRVAEGIRDATAVELDVTDSDAMKCFFADAEYPFDVVIANAGVSLPGQSALETSDETWGWLMDNNLKGAFNTMRHGAARMLADGVSGRVIATSSVAGIAAEPGYAVYAAAKWGLMGLVKSMAMELAPSGILVNGVCPGDVQTRFLSETAATDVYSGALGRPARIDEITGIYLWLAGPEASYAVGETVVLDGGLSLSAMAR